MGNNENLFCSFVKSRCNDVHENALSTVKGRAMFIIIGLSHQGAGLSKAAALQPKYLWNLSTDHVGITFL